MLTTRDYEYFASNEAKKNPANSQIRNLRITQPRTVNRNPEVNRQSEQSKIGNIYISLFLVCDS
jgi:hypothetical protein